MGSKENCLILTTSFFLHYGLLLPDCVVQGNRALRTTTSSSDDCLTGTG